MLKPLKWYKKLHTTKGRRLSGYFLAEGPRFISQLIQANREAVAEVLVGPNAKIDIPNNIPIREINETTVRELSTDKNSQKVFAAVKIPQQYFDGKLPEKLGNRVLVLESVQDPGNVGTLIRSAVAFGFGGIILDSKSADPFSPKTVHSAAGSILAPWIIRIDDLGVSLNIMKEAGFKLAVSDLDSQPSKDLSSIEKLAVVLGNEGNGVSDEMRKRADILFKIPMDDNAVESLNVGAAGAVAMYMARGV